MSCIERGRWDGRRHNDPFAVSDVAADPALRAVKREHSNRPGGNGRPDQNRVWSEVGTRLGAFGVASRTDSLEDIFAERHHALADIKAAIVALPGQVGAVVEVAGRPAALDLVSRTAVYAELAPALTSGYALQAANAKPGKANDERAERFLSKALRSDRDLTANYGLGHAFTVSRTRIVGAGVEHDGELIALSVFPREQAVA